MIITQSILLIYLDYNIDDTIKSDKYILLEKLRSDICLNISEFYLNIKEKRKYRAEGRVWNHNYMCHKQEREETPAIAVEWKTKIGVAYWIPRPSSANKIDPTASRSTRSWSSFWFSFREDIEFSASFTKWEAKMKNSFFPKIRFC